MPKLVHKIYNTSEGFWHSLIVNGKEGAKAGYAFIAENGPYRARIPDYWGDDIPRVYIEVPQSFTIEEVMQ